jgi:hypothetical protein
VSQCRLFTGARFHWVWRHCYFFCKSTCVQIGSFEIDSQWRSIEAEAFRCLKFGHNHNCIISCMYISMFHVFLVVNVWEMFFWFSIEIKTIWRLRIYQITASNVCRSVLSNTIGKFCKSMSMHVDFTWTRIETHTNRWACIFVFRAPNNCHPRVNWSFLSRCIHRLPRSCIRRILLLRFNNLCCSTISWNIV